MGEKEYLDFPASQEMMKAFQQADKQLEETIKTMKDLAKQMDDGALQGAGGQAFVQALNGPLTKKLNTLKSKMTEMAGDVKKVQDRTRQAEGEAKSDVQR